MKVLVTGSRSIEDQDYIMRVFEESPFDPSVVIHGGGSPVDDMGDVWAHDTGASIETHEVPQWVWAQIGDKAGPLRNTHMVDRADAVVVIWDGESSGTKDTMKKAESAGIPIHKRVVDVEDGQVVREIVSRTIEGEQSGLQEFI